MDTSDELATPRSFTRRRVNGLAAAGVAVPMLAACAGEDPTGMPSSSGSSAAPSETPTAAPSPTEPPASESLVAAADVPVGGGVILTDEELVVTQPSAGEFKGFSAVCTHQGCLVSAVTETIDCPCHGSKYSLTDGSVVSGPAPAPLASHPLAVDGGAITRA